MKQEPYVIAGPFESDTVSAYAVWLVELTLGCCLIRPNTPGRNIRHVVIFTAHRDARHAPQHRQLTGVRERIGDGPLKEPLRSYRTQAVRGDMLI